MEEEADIFYNFPFNSYCMIRKYLLLLFTVLALHATAQKKYSPPALSRADSWSMILLPDPQSYVKFERNQPIFELMTCWIAENIDSLKIKMVLCTGDLVEQNDIINPDFKTANQSSKRQWESVAHSFSRLDGKVAYIPAAGNHDYGYESAEVRKTQYNTYFPIEKNFLNEKMIRDAALNGEGIPTMENASFEFTSPHGKKILVLNLEFAPRDTILAWAKSVVDKPKYKDHFVIVLTHSYMESNNQFIKDAKYKLKDRNYGDVIFEKLIKPSKNIRMVFAGHICKPDDIKAHIAFRTDLNAAGNKVNQMVFNAQALGGGWYGNGGDGWLRILEFTSNNTVKVKTFSPLFAISPTTQQFAWRTESYDEFEFPLD